MLNLLYCFLYKYSTPYRSYKICKYLPTYQIALHILYYKSGGELRAHSYALVGPIACETIKKYYVDTVLISCKALDIKKGLMESNEPESIIKRQMIEQAQKSILLADSTKFDKTAFTKTCDLAQIDTIVTDKEPNIEWFDYIKENDIKLIY